MEALSPDIGCQTLLQLLILAVWLLQIIINSLYARYSRQRLSQPKSNSSHPFKLIRAVDSSYDPGNSSMPLKFPMEARSEVIQNHSNSPKRPTSNWTPPTTITPSSTVLIIWKRWRMRRRIYGLLTRPCSLNSMRSKIIRCTVPWTKTENLLAPLLSKLPTKSDLIQVHSSICQRTSPLIVEVWPSAVPLVPKEGLEITSILCRPIWTWTQQWLWHIKMTHDWVCTTKVDQWRPIWIGDGCDALRAT